MTRWIGEVFASDVGWIHLEDLVDIGNRMAGTEGERAAAEVTRDVLDEYARNARFETFEIQGWERGSASIETPVSSESAIALPRSPSASVEGELVDLGYGLPSDFEAADLEGKIVLVASNVPDWYDRYIHRREKYYYAVQGGAAGFIYQNHVEGCLPPTGSVGSSGQPIGEIPAVGVSSEVGARLSRRFDGDRLELSIDAEIDDATSQNVHAELGPDTERELLVTSHVDAHDISEGAMDNGAGTAMVVELARALAMREDELETKVHFVAFGAEEVGLVGSGYDASERDLDSVKAVLNLDGVVRARTLSFNTHGFDPLGSVVESVADQFGHRVYVSPEQGPNSDHWPYVKWGVPGYHVASRTDDEGRGWGHTYADTLDKLEKRDLNEQAILLTETAVRLAGEDVEIPHKDPEEIATALEEEGIAEGMKVTGEWPY